MVKNRRSNYYRGQTGLRVVRMYVEEFFHWGFQLYDQENDDGIDGEIIVRDKSGQDLGVRVYVQVKSGPGYISSIDKHYISVHAYSGESYIRHQETYNKSLQPVILIFVNSQKNANGKIYEDLFKPDAWWVRLDGYVEDGTSLYRIPVTNRFGAHSKGDLMKLVKHLLKDWNHYPEYELNEIEKKHYASLNLATDSSCFYKVWSKDSSMMYLENGDIKVYVTRIGWRHINSYKRGLERRNISLKLLRIARRIIEDATIRNIVMLRHYQRGKYAELFYYGIRTRVNMGNGKIEKVQVVLRRWRNQGPKNIDKWWFYSVHIIKK